MTEGSEIAPRISRRSFGKVGLAAAAAEATLLALGTSGCIQNGETPIPPTHIPTPEVVPVGGVIEIAIDNATYEGENANILQTFSNLVPELKPAGTTETSVSPKFSIDGNDQYESFRLVGLTYAMPMGGEQVPITGCLAQKKDGSVVTQLVLWTIPKGPTPEGVITATGFVLEVVKGQSGPLLQQKKVDGQPVLFGTFQQDQMGNPVSMDFSLPGSSTPVDSRTQTSGNDIMVFYRAPGLSPTPTAPAESPTPAPTEVEKAVSSIPQAELEQLGLTSGIQFEGMFKGDTTPRKVQITTNIPGLTFSETSDNEAYMTLVQAVDVGIANYDETRGQVLGNDTTNASVRVEIRTIEEGIAAEQSGHPDVFLRYTGPDGKIESGAMVALVYSATDGTKVYTYYTSKTSEDRMHERGAVWMRVAYDTMVVLKANDPDYLKQLIAAGFQGPLLDNLDETVMSSVKSAGANWQALHGTYNGSDF